MQSNVRQFPVRILALQRALFFFFVGVFMLGARVSGADAQTAASSNTIASRTAKAMTYRRGGGAVRVSLHGTDLMAQGTGEASVENKGNRVEIEAKFQNMEDATKFGLEYLTYVLWAVSPEGRAVNLGEVQIKNGSAQVKAITDMQTFAMVVTAEPYFAVSQPGDEVVLENAGERAARTSPRPIRCSGAESIRLRTQRSTTRFSASTARRQRNSLKHATPSASQTTPMPGSTPPTCWQRPMNSCRRRRTPTGRSATAKS